MPNTYNRRQFMRAVLLGGGMLVTGLAPVLTPVQAAASVAVCRQTMLFMGTMVSISRTLVRIANTFFIRFSP